MEFHFLTVLFLTTFSPVPPWITSRISQKKVQLKCGEALPETTCAAFGSPKPLIVWKHDDNVLVSRTGGSLTMNIISSVALRHAGRYTCEASNTFGIAKQYFDLEVVKCMSEAKLVF